METFGKKDLEKILVDAFEEVKDSFYRPPISGPEIIWEKSEQSGYGTAVINLATLKISVNAHYILKLAQGDKKKISANAKGEFSHEFGHYQFFPAELSLDLYLSFMAQKDFKEAADDIYSYYIDYINDILVIQNDFNKEDLKSSLKSIWQTSDKHPLRAAIWKAYDEREAEDEHKVKTRIMELGLGIDVKKYTTDIIPKIEHAVSELKSIIVSASQDCGLQYSQLLRFGEAIKPLLPKQKSQGSHPNGKKQLITPEDIKNLPVHLQNKVEEELKKLMTKLPKDLYGDIKKHFFGKEEPVEGAGSGIGDTPDKMKLAEKETIDYYRDLAQQFGIYIRPKRSLSMSTVNITFGKKDFKPTDSSLALDLRFSGGKILPGLTKTVRKEKVPFPNTQEIIPNLILYKDASGSMPDPKEHKCYGTAAGTIFILSYLRSYANVGIALFDAETSSVLFSRKEDELLKVLCGYKGGGTEVDIEQLKKDLEKSNDYRLRLDQGLNMEEIKRNPFFRRYLIKNAKITGVDRLQIKGNTDFVIITDGGIGNIKTLIDIFHEHKEYRPTIIHTGSYTLDVEGYDQKTSGFFDGITIYKAGNREDIIGITKKTLIHNLLK
jgi:hypothetical protein